MKNGFVLSIDLMIAMTLFTGLLYMVQNNQLSVQNLNSETLIKESAYVTASDCLVIVENAIYSKNESMINDTLGKCTQLRSNLLVNYYGDVNTSLEIKNFEGSDSISARRILTLTNESKAEEFIIAFLEVET